MIAQLYRNGQKDENWKIDIATSSKSLNQNIVILYLLIVNDGEWDSVRTEID